MGRLASFSERRGLYRNTSRGWVAGVCAGIGDFIGVKPIWVRAAFIALMCVTHCVAAIIFYIVLVFVLKPRSGVDSAPASWSQGIRPDRIFADRYMFATAPAAQPAGDRLTTLKIRFTALEARLSRLEAAVMSDEILLRRKFRDLGGDVR
jgi:phage shock protein C